MSAASHWIREAKECIRQADELQKAVDAGLLSGDELLTAQAKIMALLRKAREEEKAARFATVVQLLPFKNKPNKGNISKTDTRLDFLRPVLSQIPNEKRQAMANAAWKAGAQSHFSSYEQLYGFLTKSRVQEILTVSENR